MVDEEQTKEESARMDALMRKLLGGAEDEEEDEMDVTATQECTYAYISLFAINVKSKYNLFVC
jgi:hypothetical protein